MIIQNIILTFAFIGYGFFNPTLAQEYCSFYNSINCKPENIEGYQISSLSKGHKIGVGESITYEVVLYGGNEIIIQCCTEDDFYPVHFKIRSIDRGNVIYDNKYNHYLSNLNLQLDYTELMAIEISVEPRKKRAQKSDEKVKVGLAIYIENAFFETVNEKI